MAATKLHSHTMQAFLAQTHDWFERCHCLGREIPSAHEYQSWGLAALDLAREHSFAIRRLLDPVQQRMLASASALLRPLLEATLRGYRFSYCGLSDDEARVFQDGHNSYSIASLISKIEPVAPRAAEQFRAMIAVIERPLHRYTHGDVHQLSRRLNQTLNGETSEPLNVIRPLLDERDVIAVLYVANRLTLLAMDAILEQAGDFEACASITLRHEELDRLLDTVGDLFRQGAVSEGSESEMKGEKG